MTALLLLAQTLLALKLSTTAGIAPILTYARISVSGIIKGQVCLRWEEKETPGVEESCWQAEQGPRTVWKNIRLTEAGSWTFWVQAGALRSNEERVEVR